jgi:hypothetical protein
MVNAHALNASFPNNPPLLHPTYPHHARPLRHALLNASGIKANSITAEIPTTKAISTPHITLGSLPVTTKPPASKVIALITATFVTAPLGVSDHHRAQTMISATDSTITAMAKPTKIAAVALSAPLISIANHHAHAASNKVIAVYPNAVSERPINIK